MKFNSKFFAKLKDFDVKTCLGIIAFLGVFMLIFCAVFWSACAVEYAKADVTTWDTDTWYYIDSSNTWYNPSSTEQYGVANCRVYLSENGAEPSSAISGASIANIRFMNGYGISFWDTGSSTTADKYTQWQGSAPTFTPAGGISTAYPNGRIYFKFGSLPDSTLLQKLSTYSTSTVVPGPAIDLNSYAVVPLLSSYWTQTAPATFGLVGAEVTNADSYRMGDIVNPYTVRLSVTYKHNTLDYDHTQIVLLANVGTTGSMKYYFVPFDEHYSDLTRIDIYFADDTLPAPITQITNSSFFAVAGDNYNYMTYLITHSDLYQDGVQFAVGIAYDQGYEAGYTEQNNLIAVMWESFSLPVRLLFGEWQVDDDTGVGQYVGGLFNFTVLGVDIRAFVLAILTILILVTIVKFILGLRR